MFFNLFRKKPVSNPEIVTLTEAEFKFLADGVHDGGLLGAYSTNAAALDLASSLESKGCIERAGRLPALPGNGREYFAWSMTSKGIDAALGHFIPAPGWSPFKKALGHDAR